MEGFKPPKSLLLEGNISENWRKYKQNFEIYIKATRKDIESEDVQVAIFLNLIGEEAVELYNTFNLNTEDRKKLSKVMEAFEKYCMPKKNVVFERYMFNKRAQKEGETFEQFLTDLKKLARTCEFSNMVDEMVRDRIVLGINDTSVQERLLRMESLTLQKASDQCRAAEAAKAQAKDLKEVQGAAQVAMITTRKGRKKNERPNAGGKDESSKSVAAETFNCKRCARRHGPRQCPAYGKECHKCGKPNHFANCCRVKQVEDIRADGTSDSEEDILYADSVTTNVHSIKAWYENIQIEDTKTQFKIDSGSDTNIIPYKLFKKLDQQFKIRPTNVMLRAYGGFEIKVVGTVNLRCRVRGMESYEDFVIANVDDKPIIGREASVKLGLLRRIDELQTESAKNRFIETNKDLFEGLGKFPNKCSIEVRKHCIPIANPPRRIPKCIKDKLGKTLRKLEEKGIISKVEKPKGWVSNVVIVEKADKSLRICLDPKNLNEAIEYYPKVTIPTVEEISENLSGKNLFSVLDLKDGFWHVELDENSSELCTFSTPLGCWKFNRLPFGLSMAPEYFQFINQHNFSDIEGVQIYFDDLIIFAKSREEHDRIMDKVVARARKLGIKFNKKKIQYRQSKVKYLGQIFTSNGMMIDPDRMCAITNLKEPQNKKELQSILGMINYLRKYIPNLAEVSNPLRELLKSNVEFQWLEMHTNTFNKIKKMLTEAPTLVNFDSNKEVTIQTDASKSGLGCCLMQEGKPVAYSSRSLNDAEQNYAMIEKEMLGIVYATHKFHQFIYGRKIKIITDHKPLVSIINVKKISDIASFRLQRMKLKLLKYDLNVKYVPGKQMHIADLLSRNYELNVCHDTEWITEVVHSVCIGLNITDERKKQFRDATQNDPILRKLIEYYQSGWPTNKKNVDPSVQFYIKYQNDITVEEDLVFYNYRLIVPKDLRQYVLNLLHEAHLGVEKTKTRARQSIYWPGLMIDIENMVAKCRVCERYRSKNVKEPLIPHDIPNICFNKIACDICETGGKSYLIMQDYFSKWLEILPLKNKTSSEVIRKMKSVFATHGIPKIVVSDNMPFNSLEHQQFAKEWQFQIITSSPRYPQSNGQAERAVQVAKRLIKKCRDDNRDLNMALLEFRNCPITGLKESPSQILMSRLTRTKLPVHTKLLQPVVNTSTHKNLKKQQARYKYYYDRNVKARKHDFKEGDNAVVHKQDRWEPARIISQHSSPRSFIVQDQNGETLRRNTIHLRKSYNEYKRSQKPEINVETHQDIPSSDILDPQVDDSPKDNHVDPSEQSDQRAENPSEPVLMTRRGRVIKRPAKYLE